MTGVFGQAFHLFLFLCLNIAGRVIDQGWALARIYIREPREPMRLTASITMYIETARQKSNFLGLETLIGQLIIDTTPRFFSIYTILLWLHQELVRVQ